MKDTGSLSHRKNFTGQSFWASGYYVSTVGRDEALVREYIPSLSLWGQ
jgi:putative transposase